MPGLSDSKTQWPYTAVGVAFALLGIVCIAYGERRRLSVDHAVRRGEFVGADPRLTMA